MTDQRADAPPQVVRRPRTGWLAWADRTLDQRAYDLQPLVEWAVHPAVAPARWKTPDSPQERKTYRDFLEAFHSSAPLHSPAQRWWWTSIIAAQGTGIAVIGAAASTKTLLRRDEARGEQVIRWTDTSPLGALCFAAGMTEPAEAHDWLADGSAPLANLVAMAALHRVTLPAHLYRPLPIGPAPDIP